MCFLRAGAEPTAAARRLPGESALSIGRLQALAASPTVAKNSSGPLVSRRESTSHQARSPITAAKGSRARSLGLKGQASAGRERQDGQGENRDRGALELEMALLELPGEARAVSRGREVDPSDEKAPAQPEDHRQHEPAAVAIAFVRASTRRPRPSAASARASGSSAMVSATATSWWFKPPPRSSLRRSPRPRRGTTARPGAR